MSDTLPAPADVLPHRPPFLFLDRVLRCDAERAVAERTFAADEPFFAGHFPGNPVVPGVILVEAMAQTLAYLALRARGGGTVLLTGIDGCKVRRPVRPGETVTFSVEVTKAKMGLVVARAEAAVGDEPCASAELRGYLAPGG